MSRSRSSATRYVAVLFLLLAPGRGLADWDCMCLSSESIGAGSVRYTVTVSAAGLIACCEGTASIPFFRLCICDEGERFVGTCRYATGTYDLTPGSGGSGGTLQAACGGETETSFAGAYGPGPGSAGQAVPGATHSCVAGSDLGGPG